MALQYYARILLITHLLPLLRKSPYARVISILAGGLETHPETLYKLHAADPGLRSTFSLRSVAATQPSYTTYMLDRLARENNVVFIHNHPGVVATDIFRTSWSEDGVAGTVWRGVARYVVAPVLRVFALAPEVAGERGLFLLTSGVYAGEDEGEVDDGRRGRGAYVVDWCFRTVNRDKFISEMESTGMGEVVWKHTMEVLAPHV